MKAFKKGIDHSLGLFFCKFFLSKNASACHQKKQENRLFHSVVEIGLIAN